MSIVITIARQVGAGGAPLGKRLAARLGIAYLDKEILRLAAEKLGADPADLARWDEHRSRFWDRVGRALSMGAPESACTPANVSEVIQDRQVFELQSQVIREQGRQSCVIIGRAAFWVLRDHPGLVSVFLHAPVEHRVPEVMAVFKVDAPRARQIIADLDADRARFVRETTGREITAQSQHLCLDTSKVPVELAEEWIVQLVQRTQTAA